MAGWSFGSWEDAACSGRVIKVYCGSRNDTGAGGKYLLAEAIIHYSGSCVLSIGEMRN